MDERPDAVKDESVPSALQYRMPSRGSPPSGAGSTRPTPGTPYPQHGPTGGGKAEGMPGRSTPAKTSHGDNPVWEESSPWAWSSPSIRSTGPDESSPHKEASTARKALEGAVPRLESSLSQVSHI